MKKALFIIVILSGLFVIQTTPSSSAPITSPSQLGPNPTIIDFEQFTPGYNQGQPISNPLVIGDVTFSTNGQLYIRDVSGAPMNGTEVESMVLETEPDTVPLQITFLTPIAEVLLGWGDPNFPGNYLRAYDVNNNLLESIELTDLGPTQGVHATWIGFARTIADISRIEVVPPTTVPPDQPYDNFEIDNIHYNTVASYAVPEPTTMLLLGFGLIGLVGIRRLRK